MRNLIIVTAVLLMLVFVAVCATRGNEAQGHSDYHEYCSFGHTEHGMHSHRHIVDGGRHYLVSCDPSESADYRHTDPAIPPGRSPVESSADFTPEKARERFSQMTSYESGGRKQHTKMASGEVSYRVIWLRAGRGGFPSHCVEEGDNPEEARRLAGEAGRDDLDSFRERHPLARNFSELRVKRHHISWSYDRPGGYFEWCWSYDYDYPVRIAPPTPTPLPMPTETPAPTPTLVPVAAATPVPTETPVPTPTPTPTSVPVAVATPTPTPIVIEPKPTPTPDEPVYHHPAPDPVPDPTPVPGPGTYVVNGVTHLHDPRFPNESFPLNEDDPDNPCWEGWTPPPDYTGYPGC